MYPKTGSGGWSRTTGGRLMRPTWMLILPAINLAVPRGNDPLLLAWQANVRPWTLWNHDLILSDFSPLVKWYPWSDSNWHYTPFERVASANWATRANSFGTGCWVRTNDLSLIKRLLYRWVNPVMVVISGIDPLSMPYEGSTHPSTSYHHKGNN